MKFVGVRDASFESWVVGAILGSVHLGLVVLLILGSMHGSHDAQWQLMFAPFLLLDLPILIIGYPVALGIGQFLHLVGVHFGTYGVDYLFFGVAHGIIGSMFYTIVPAAISAHLHSRRSVA